MKKIISLLLAFAMSFVFCFPAAATVVNEEAQLMEREFSLVGKDLPNGDAVFYLKNGNQIISSSYVSRERGTAVYRNYQTNIVEETQTNNSRLASSPNLAKASYTYRGAITYEYYGPNFEEPQGQRVLDCSYSFEIDDYDQYNLNGKYQDAAQVVGVICSFFALPAGIASVFVQHICSYLGFGLGVLGPIIIPDMMGDCTSTTVTWELQDQNISSLLGYLEGTRYDFEYDGEECTEYEGHYYPVTSFAERDYDFAYDAYTCVYGQGRCSVIEWD